MNLNTVSTSVDYQLLNMANRIKFFCLTQIYFQTLGICPTNPNQKYSFNVTSFCILFSMILMITSTASFFFTKAETMEECLQSFYFSTTEFTFVMCFLVNIWKMPNILQLIGKYEEFIEKSESKDFIEMKCRKNFHNTSPKCIQ